MADIFADCAPLPQACVKALTDRMVEKRKLAASEIEKMTVEFSMSNNIEMVDILIQVLKRFCLSPTPNIKKGGLLGLAAVMVGYNNGTETKVPQKTVEEIIRPILTCFADPDSRVRYFACESLYNVTKVAKENVIPLFESIFDNMSKIVADPDVGVRSGAELLDRSLKDIIVEQQTLDIQSFIPRLEEYIYTRNSFTRMFIISWIRLLDSKIDMITHLPILLDGIFNCLYDSEEEIRASTLSLLSEFLQKIITRPTEKVYIPSFISTLLKHARKDSEDVVRLTAISWLRQFIGLMDGQNQLDFSSEILSAIFLCLGSDRHPPNIYNLVSEAPSQFIQALCEMFRDNEHVFKERGTFIVLNLCNILEPKEVYKTFAEIVKEEKLDLKFAYNLVQKLNQILLTTQSLSEFRSRLGHDDDPEMNALFYTLYYAWCLSPIATLTLCLLTNNYRHASEIVLALSLTDINVDLLTQIDWTVQLIESPVFASLRMRLLDVNNNQYLLQSLYGLLMILPQSEAYRKLGHRLDQAYKFMSVYHPPQPSKSSSLATTTQQSGSGNKPPGTLGQAGTSGSGGGGGGGKKTTTTTSAATTATTTIGLEALMKHYFSVQNQMRETIASRP